MLSVNVGMSRKVSHDFQSTGFSVNLEGEISASLDQPDRVIDQIRNIYDLAEACLSDQIERYRSESGLQPKDSTIEKGRKLSGSSDTAERSTVTITPISPSNGKTTHDNANDRNDMSTNKQVQYIATLTKKIGLTQDELSQRIETSIGRFATPFDLTKREAALVIEDLLAIKPISARK